MRWPAGALRSPTTGLDLVVDRAHSLTDGVGRWPVVDRVPILSGDAACRADVLALLDAGEDRRARLRLLGTDVLDGPIAALLSGDSTLGTALEALGLDPDATRRHAWLLPTHLAEVTLLAARLPGSPTLVLGADVGALAHMLSRAGVGTIAVTDDARLAWVMRRYVTPAALLAVVAPDGPLPFGDGAVATVVVREPWLAADGERDARLDEAMRVGATVVLTGRRDDAAALSGRASGVLVGATTTTLVSALDRGRRPVLQRFDALPAEGRIHVTTLPDRAGPLDLPPSGTSLRRNPLLLGRPGLLDGHAAAWPQPTSPPEVAAHLPTWNETQLPPDVRDGAIAGSSPLVDELARRRVLVDLPARW